MPHHSGGTEINMEPKPTGRYAPLSPWAYFGLTILFQIPFVGLVFLIVFSISNGNINRRNFARSYWCVLVVIFVIAAIVMIVSLATGTMSAILGALSNK